MLSIYRSQIMGVPKIDIAPSQAVRPAQNITSFRDIDTLQKSLLFLDWQGCNIAHKKHRYQNIDVIDIRTSMLQILEHLHYRYIFLYIGCPNNRRPHDSSKYFQLKISILHHFLDWLGCKIAYKKHRYYRQRNINVYERYIHISFLYSECSRNRRRASEGCQTFSRLFAVRPYQGSLKCHNMSLVKYRQSSKY